MTIKDLCHRLQIPTGLLTAVKDSFDAPYAYFHNYTLCERTALGVYHLREELFYPRHEDRTYVMAGLLAYAHHSQGKMSYADELALSMRFAQDTLTAMKEPSQTIEEILRIIQLADAPQNSRLSSADRLLVSAGSLDFLYDDWAMRFIEWEKESALKHQRVAEEHQAIRRAVAKLDGRMQFWPDVIKAKYLAWRTQFLAPADQSKSIGF